MTDQIREQLSALLDGELPRDELGLLVRRLEKDATLRRTFGTYALIGETLRAPGGRIATNSFASRVSAAISASDGDSASAGNTGRADISMQPTLAAGRATARTGSNVRHVTFWQRPIVRTALAASAATAAVLLFKPDATTRNVVADLEVPAVASAASFGASPTPAQSQRLASYMVAHSQYSTPLVRRNVLSGLLAADSSITRVAYDIGDAP
jgi:sigma-E factor negative regulatory protein RseA